MTHITYHVSWPSPATWSLRIWPLYVAVNFGSPRLTFGSLFPAVGHSDAAVALAMPLDGQARPLRSPEDLAA